MISIGLFLEVVASLFWDPQAAFWLLSASSVVSAVGMIALAYAYTPRKEFALASSVPLYARYGSEFLSALMATYVAVSSTMEFLDKKNPRTLLVVVAFALLALAHAAVAIMADNPFSGPVALARLLEACAYALVLSATLGRKHG